MKAIALIRMAWVGLLAAGALSACSSTNDTSGELVGKASLAITSVPSDVGCIRVTVSGTRTVVSTVSVMTGQSSNFSLSGLPLGNVSFSAEGFGGACPPAPSAIATWLGAPVSAFVAVDPPVDVTIKMVHNGRSNVGVDFDDSASASCSDMLRNGSETDVDCGGSVCAPCATGKACAVGSDCTANACVNGVCGGCLSDAECPAGLTCLVASGQCVSTCAAPKAFCGGTCADLSSDPLNCGSCGQACMPGSSCTNGICTNACAPGEVRCGPSCTNLQNDPNNCGGCGHACPAGMSCLMFSCLVPPPSCSDGIRDGSETGVDCGGPSPCPRCAIMQPCLSPSDCSSNRCLGGLCAP